MPLKVLIGPIAAATIVTAFWFAAMWRSHQMERRGGMKAILITAATAFFVSGQASAKYTAYGIGTSSCATWLQGEPNLTVGKHYITGAWTAMNVLNPHGHFDVGSSTDAPGIVGEVKKRCEAHPSEGFIDAILNTYVEFDKAGK